MRSTRDAPRVSGQDGNVGNLAAQIARGVLCLQMGVAVDKNELRILKSGNA